MVDKKKIESAVKDILEAIGENVTRTGLLDTPSRVANMYEEIFMGTHEDPLQYIKTFTEPNLDQDVVIVKDIPLYSMCEHHMMPFMGKVSIGYIPKDEVIMGLSKFARIVNCFSKRLQIQERLTSQICDFLLEGLDAEGVVVVVEAEHTCMTMRGAKSIGAVTRTVSFGGVFKEDVQRRTEIISLLKD